MAPEGIAVRYAPYASVVKRNPPNREDAKKGYVQVRRRCLVSYHDLCEEMDTHCKNYKRRCDLKDSQPNVHSGTNSLWLLPAGPGLVCTRVAAIRKAYSRGGRSSGQHAGLPGSGSGSRFHRCPKLSAERGSTGAAGGHNWNKYIPIKVRRHLFLLPFYPAPQSSRRVNDRKCI